MAGEVCMSKIVGVDLGTTLTKFAWEDNAVSNNKFNFASSRGIHVEQTVKNLLKSGFDTAVLTGINREDERLLAPLNLVRPAGNPVDIEIELQAQGARKLLDMSGRSDVGDFLIVSIGTGTSYTFVTNSGANRYPLGSGIGGGFVEGILKLAQIRLSIVEEDDLLEEGGMFIRQLYDKQIKDVLKKTADTPWGKVSIAHFGNVPDGIRCKENVAATALNCVATNIVRDIAKMEFMPKYLPPKHVVFVGTIPTSSPVLRKFITDLFQNIGQLLPDWREHEAIFPPNAEYAGALGAWLNGQ